MLTIKKIDRIEVGIHAIRINMLTPMPEITDLDKFNKIY